MGCRWRNQTPPRCKIGASAQKRSPAADGQPYPFEFGSEKLYP